MFRQDGFSLFGDLAQIWRLSMMTGQASGILQISEVYRMQSVRLSLVAKKRTHWKFWKPHLTLAHQRLLIKILIPEKRL